MGNDTIDMYEINWFFYMKVHEKLRTSIDIIQKRRAQSLWFRANV